MASIMRVKLRWSGFVGAPGYSIFHFRDDLVGTPTNTEAQEAVDACDAYAEAIKSTLPSVVQLQCERDVEVLEETTGELIDVLNATPAAAHNNTGAIGVSYAGPVGGVINWRTAGVRKGRRVRGRSFVVPMNSNAYQADGSLTSGALTSLNTAADVFILGASSAAHLGVWARPSKGGSDGVWHKAISANVPDMAAVLRSRRD